MPILTTPPVITPEIQEFCKSINPAADPVYVPVDPQPGKREQYCNTNVTAQVAEHGGEIVTGWTIWAKDDFVEGEFHMVWKRPDDGVLIDITPKSDGETQILFLPQEITIDHSKPICNIRKALKDTPETREILRAGQAHDRLREKYWRGWDKGSAIPRDELMRAYWPTAGYTNVPERAPQRPGRNDPCWCGSGKKYKKCHLGTD